MSDNKIEFENLQMLRALYDFTATFEKTLSFRENDYFILHQTSTKQRNWWQVVNDKGEMGFVPSNYVETIKVTPQFQVQYIDNCISSLRAKSGKSGLSNDKQELILRLAEKKRQTEQSNHKKGQAPKPPSSVGSSEDLSTTEMPKLIFKKSDSDISSTSSVRKTSSSFSSSAAAGDGLNVYPGSINDKKENSKIEDDIIQPPHNYQENHISDSSGAIISPTTNSQKSECAINNKSSLNDSLRKLSISDIGQKPIYELVETVRRNTKLSHEMSRVAVVTVIEGLQQLIPIDMEPYFSTILLYVQDGLKAPEPLIGQTHDATRLKTIFTELSMCKEDSQQRSWMLHEDESIIIEYIQELISILSNADANVTRHVMSEDQYNDIVSLIQYYQMEVRWSIRQLLLQAFGVMCSLDKIIVNIMLNSVLPMELARDMKANPSNIQKLNYSSLLLTMIFSMGEKMPITHLEQFDVDFLIFLFNMIESPPETDIDDQIPDLFLNLILAFNLQFDVDSDENIAMIAATKLEDAKVLTEKILLLLNREDDPVRIFDHVPAPPHSVVKLFIDLFSNSHTAELFYTNDVKVLIDIIVRQLSDISPGDTRRQTYLELCQRILRNTNYSDHLHRREDILKCFTRIFCEEAEQSYEDQKLVKQISIEFPQYFQK